MIDAKALVAAHEANKAALQEGAQGESADPAPRQFPLAGKSEVRPLADPSRQNPASKE